MARARRDRLVAPVAVVLRAASVGLAVPVAYLTVLTAVAWGATAVRWRRPRASTAAAGRARRRFAVLVPAHDEAQVIAETLGALQRVEYPDDRYEVHVLADHCSDGTAAIARSLGACVHEIDGELRGKGPALAGAIARLTDPELVSDDDPLGAIVVVDADTIVAPGFLLALDAAFEAGADAVQGHYRVLEPGGSTGAALRAAALASRHHLRPLARTTLGASSGLYGNGMAFTPRLLAGRKWSNHLTEDIELQQELLLDGTCVAYAPDAVVEAAMPATLEGATTQNERWERGRIELARRYVPRLVRRAVTRRGRERVAAVDGVLDHVTPPMSVLVAAVGVVGAAGAGVALVRGRRLRGSLVLPAAVTVHVLSGLILDEAPRSVYRSLLHAPSMVLWKVRLWGRMLVRRGEMDWVRTARPGDAATGSSAHPEQLEVTT
ncbi:MAG: glycosyltransferase family 2 protein [Ilumatobacteraceae bacterium]